MTATFILPLTLSLMGQAAPSKGVKGDEPSVRLEFMKKSAASYAIRPADDPNTVFRLQTEPVLRFTNSVGATKDGAVFLWLGEGDRPEVTAQIFVKRDGYRVHELTSLSSGALVGKAPGKPDWRPSRGGVKFEVVPGAPVPSSTAEQRLLQMRALAREFTADDKFRDQSWQTLRMLTKPFARYGKPGTDLIDGALFCYVLTTDPEVYLILEARAGKNGPEWHYAFAPMTIYPVRASWKGRTVWELPYRWQEASDPSQPFHFWVFPVEP